MGHACLSHLTRPEPTCARPPAGVEAQEGASGGDADGAGASSSGGGALEAAGRPRSELAFPGAYRSMCVTLRLQHLAVAAVEAADGLAELEGAAGPATGAAGPAFKVLRALQAAWIRDATANHNV